MDEKNITRLQYMEKEIILIGTAHVSKDSVELVREVIDEERPDSVCIELDEKRFENIQNPKAWEQTDVAQVIKSKKVGFMLANLILSSYQKKLAKKMDSPVGGEMLQGIKSAKEIGAALVLADRDIQTTLMRIWRKLGFVEKTKLLYSLLFSMEDGDEEISEDDIKRMMEEDMLESALSSVRKEFPKIGDVLISERDQHLASKIKKAPGNKVVAVLGGAHIPGVKEEIFKEQNLSEITMVPPKSFFSKYAGWIIPLIIVGVLIYAFVGGMQNGFQQLGVWALWTSGFAALFTALSLAHPLSILTAAVMAPLTTLHPLLACGWFAGLVEAGIKKPTVQDVLNIPTDIFSFKGFFRNRFLKILLVVLLSNIGGSIGTFVAGTNLIRNLFG